MSLSEVAFFATRLGVPDMNARFQPATEPGQSSPPKWEQPPALTIASNGYIVHTSDGAEGFFDYSSERLVGLHISVLVPALNEIQGSDNKNLALIRYLSRCGVTFTAHTRSHRCFPCNLSIVGLHDSRQGSYRVVVTEAESHY